MSAFTFRAGKKERSRKAPYFNVAKNCSSVFVEFVGGGGGVGGDQTHVACTFFPYHFDLISSLFFLAFRSFPSSLEIDFFLFGLAVIRSTEGLHFNGIPPPTSGK